MADLTIKDKYPGLGAIGRRLIFGPWRGAIHRAVLSLAAMVVVIGLTAIWVLSLRGEALDVAEANLSRVNFVLGESLERLFAGIDLALIETAADAARAPEAASGEGVRARLRERAARLPVVQPLVVTDATGRVINMSGPMVLTASMGVTDRAYFVDHRDHPALGLVISDPVQSRANSQWTFILSRRITGANGAFLGVALAALDMRPLEALFAQAVPETDARVTLLRKDMVLLLSHPYASELYGRSIARVARDGDLSADGRTSGSGREVSPVDHRSRVVAARRLPSYPFIVSIAVPEDTILESWRRLASGIGAVVVAVTLGLGALFVKLRRQTLRRQTSERACAAVEGELLLERARLASAVEASRDGFWEWNIGTGMVDWSERCCDLMGLPAGGGVLHIDQVVAMIDAEDRDAYRTALRAHLEDGEPFEVVARWHGLDGTVRWLMSRGRAVRDPQGQPRLLVGAHTVIGG